MSSVSLKVSINPAIAKDLKNGNLLCMICNTQVKSKIWTAHSNGRKHRENIERLKKRHAASTQLALKRPPPELDPQEASPSSAPVKKSREEKVDAEMETIPSTQTPWQRGNKVEENKSKRPSRKNVIEGVPEGFFDDEKLNSRVVERIEKEEVMEKEFSKFMNELNEAELEKEEQQDIEEESTAIEHDIEHIDEQINHWKRVNRLELKREEIYSKSTVPNETEQRLGQEKQMEISGDDENDADGDDDFDFDPSNWRSKQI